MDAMRRIWWLVLAAGVSAACAPAEDLYVTERYRAQLRQVYAEAERVQQLVVIAQEGCNAIRHLEAYWLARCLEINNAPPTLTLALIDKDGHAVKER